MIAQYDAYTAKPSDYRVDASSVLAGLRRWVDLNGQDDRWVETVAEAFRAADSGGGPASVEDGQIAALLRANGVPDGLRPGIVAPSVPTSRDVAVIARWWAGLTPDEREALVANDPKLIGSLAGVPTQWRDRANRRALRQTIEGLEGERDAAAERLAELREDLRAHPYNRVLAIQMAGAQQQLNAIQRRLDGPTNLERQLVAVARDPRNRLDARDVYLLDFDPDFADGDGKAVVALGDPRTADHIGVVVPGAGAKHTNERSVPRGHVWAAEQPMTKFSTGRGPPRSTRTRRNRR